MVELDVQQTADGVPVVFHDESLYTACGLNEEVGSLSVDEVTALKYRATDEQVTTLNAALSLSVRSCVVASYWTSARPGASRITVVLPSWSRNVVSRGQPQRSRKTPGSQATGEMHDASCVARGSSENRGRREGRSRQSVLVCCRGGARDRARGQLQGCESSRSFRRSTRSDTPATPIVKPLKRTLSDCPVPACTDSRSTRCSMILSHSEAPESATTDLPPDPAARNPASRGRC